MLYVTRRSVVAGLCLSVPLLVTGVAEAGGKKADAMIAQGRYIARVGGCNDCHTAGYLMSEGKTPEAEWLKGDSFGWRGPWGTTYAPNLRLFMQNLTEDAWVKEARSLKRRPPMPWFTLNTMHEKDLRALYRFVRSLGEPGMQAPAYIPPEVEPPMPYALFPSPPEPGMKSGGEMKK